ncbi:sugar ABC transporter substrate-binding protein [Nonomuraea jabiensis]|uniref:sugar ABC transporter substrate-binding protein n=1 Tax=Nonomuraea jabiensis TaxID=882448 RepID=UPI0036A439DA
MLKLKRLPAAVAAITAAGLLAACSGTSTTTAADAGGGGKTISIGYSTPVAAQVSAQNLALGLKNAAASLNWQLDILDANLSADKQISDVQTMLQQGKAAIGTWTLDAGAAGGAYAQAQAAGVPVVGVNSEGTGITAGVWWQINMCDAPDAPYKRTAQLIAKQRPGAKVVVMGGPPVPSIINNAKCFTEAAKAAGLTVLPQADNTKDNSAGASALASDLLTKHGDVDAFWAYNDSTALGISAAVTQAGLKISTKGSDGVIVIGANADPDAVEAVKQGRLTGTWDPDGVATGWAVVKAMRDILDKKPAQKIVVKSTWYDGDTISSYVAPDQRKYTLDSLPLVTAAQ